jgi:hypothetical protein
VAHENIMGKAVDSGTFGLCASPGLSHLPNLAERPQRSPRLPSQLPWELTEGANIGIA